MSDKFPVELIGCELEWRRVGTNWILLHKRRQLGRCVPDPNHPGMWRSRRADGQLSDTANLSWTKAAVLAAAHRELEFEYRRRCANDPQKCQEKDGLFEGPSSPVRQNPAGAP